MCYDAGKEIYNVKIKYGNAVFLFLLQKINYQIYL